MRPKLHWFLCKNELYTLNHVHRMASNNNFVPKDRVFMSSSETSNAVGFALQCPIAHVHSTLRMRFCSYFVRKTLPRKWPFPNHIEFFWKLCVYITFIKHLCSIRRQVEIQWKFSFFFENIQMFINFINERSTVHGLKISLWV